MVLPDVRLKDLFELWEKLVVLGLATPNVGLISDIIACPGLDYCSLANTRSTLERRETQLETHTDLRSAALANGGTARSHRKQGTCVYCGMRHRAAAAVP